MDTLELIELVFDVIPDVIGIQDCHHKTIRYNSAGYKFLNMDHEEIEGKKCYELIGKNTPCDICATTECYNTKKSSQVEKYVEEMGVWLEVRAYPVFDDNGDIMNVIEHFRDITQRKLMEIRLLMLERAMNQSIDGIAVSDMDGFNKFINPAWAKMHGYSVEELEGEHLSRFHPKKQMDETVAPFLDHVMSCGSHRGESEHTRKDGSVFPTWMMVNIVKDEFGKALGVVGTARDITEQKRVEKQLQEYRDNLEKRIDERTSELTISNAQLSQALSKIQDLKDQLEAENINLREEIKLEHNYEEIIGQSDPLKYVLFKIEEVAPTDSTVLILGQTGTGKELFSRAIHNNSSRKSRPLIKVDCTTLPANLIESELFGHERGAFSGAVQQRKGRFEIANGSTLFLDEIGELAMELQGKLLRVIEYGEFERLGSSKTIRTDVRVIAATNRDLKREVEKGRFREDLWYRLNVYSIQIPSLKDRSEDIPLLVEWLVSKFARRVGKTIKRIPQKTLEALQKYDWPGNIRELSNLIESAMISSRDKTLRIPNIPETVTRSKNKIVSMDEMEKDHITQALEACHWRVEGKKGAATLLGLNPGTLRGRMRKYGIQRP